MKRGTDYAGLENWKYRVLKTFTMDVGFILDKPIVTDFSRIDEAGALTIEKGFCWDGASGAIDTDTIMLASCVHDVFCNWMVKGLLPYNPYWDKADALLRKIATDEGMSKFRANLVYQAVKYHGRLRYGVE